jgi:CheY-like chemotaxis protein
VIDTGTGMDEQTASRLFEPFFTTKEIGKGTGLGLSVIYGIVNSHKGHLRVHSKPGEGSVFEVYLPLAGGLPEATTPSLPSPKEAQHGVATILLVEDNLEVRKLMQHILTSLGYIVLDAADGQMALTVAENHPGPIDVLVTDLVMPKIGGLELARRLAPIRREMRVLYVSGYADHEKASQALDDPSAAYLQKPFAPSDLTSKIEEILRPKKSDDA